jgi:hypothetical protein
LDASEPKCAFESLDKNNKLSEAMKSFSSTAKAYQIDFIKEKKEELLLILQQIKDIHSGVDNGEVEETI